MGYENGFNIERKEVKVNDIFVVSYDVFGFESEIETYLFLSNESTKKSTTELREEYERIRTLQCEEHTVENDSYQISFEDWIKQQGLWCKKLVQFRVEPLEKGVSKDYDSYNIYGR